MITRVTQQTQLRDSQRNLQTSRSELARLQEQATSLKKITRPSDDPVGTADSMRVRSQIAAQTQYGRNIDDGNNWLTTIDTALQTTIDVLHRVRDLTVQGANETNSAESREAIAQELEQLSDELMTQANTKYLGRTVFAGTTDTGVAFGEDYGYQGVPGSSVQRRIGPDSTVQVDADGSRAFGAGASSVFATVDRIAATLRSGGSITAEIDVVDNHRANIVGVLSQVGSRQGQIERAESNHLDSLVALEAQRSGIEDVDMAEAIMDLKTQEVTLQAALAVTARVLQPTLMDFLR